MVVKLGLSPQEEQRLRAFVNKILRKIFGLRETKLQENGESYIMLRYIHCIHRLTMGSPGVRVGE